MDHSQIAVFLPAALIVAAAPGPTVLQIFAQAMTGDPRRPASLIAGAVFANAVMVSATVFGVGAVLMASQAGFAALKWIGAGYLIYLGLHYWRMRAEPLHAGAAMGVRSGRSLFIQAALTSLTNSKGLVFYVAFLPQFVRPDDDPHGRLAVLGACYVGLCLLVDVGYALAGSALSKLTMSRRAVRLKNRLIGGALIATGLSILRFHRA